MTASVWIGPYDGEKPKYINMTDNETPTCPRCLTRPRPLRKVRQHPRTRSSKYRGYCIECDRAMAKERMRVLNATPEGKAKNRARVAAWRKRKVDQSQVSTTDS